MQTYTPADLEAILVLAAATAQKEGIDSGKYVKHFRAAVTAYDVAQAKKAPSASSGDISTLYQRVAAYPWFIESFQMAIKRNGSHSSFPPKISENEQYPTKFSTVYQKVNERFPGYKVSDSNRMDQKIFVWLTSLDRETLLESYGNAHQDRSQRRNMHYFAVVGDPSSLHAVLQSFEGNTSCFPDFVGTCFAWQNKRELVGSDRGAQPDLIYHPDRRHTCNELLLSSKPGQVLSIPVPLKFKY